jgi:hypothetical protein
VTEPDIDPRLVDYFTQRRQVRTARAATALRTLRMYERRILREAAVMGYVLGYQSGNLDGRSGQAEARVGAAIPGDGHIVDTVIQHCDSTADLYPYLAAACRGARRKITRKRMWPGEAEERYGLAPTPGEGA